MPRSFNLPRWIGRAAKEPRVAMRIVIFTLLAANLVAAVVAFNVFGASADDVRRQRETLRAQMAQLQARLGTSQRLVQKVEGAREEGDQFLEKYVIERRVLASVVQDELVRLAAESGIKMGQVQTTMEPVEGSNTLAMVTIQAGFEGSYANLAKLVNLLDKSPRFLIVESMQANAPQGATPAAAAQAGQSLNVTLKIDAFVRNPLGAEL